MAETMHAVRFHEYGPSSVLVVDDIARPEPKDGEVLVRVRVSAVNAIDWKFRAGYLQAFMPLELPHTPGLDVAGIVEQVGPGVSGYSAGDEVLAAAPGHTPSTPSLRPSHWPTNLPGSPLNRPQPCRSAASPRGWGSSTPPTLKPVSECSYTAPLAALVRWPSNSRTGRVRL